MERQGIICDDNTGELYIPSSKRPDGSVRKPRRVKEGYIPQDEVPVYENRGVQWLKSKPSLPPGLNLELADQTTSLSATGLSKTAKKNLKRKEKKKQSREAGKINCKDDITEQHVNDTDVSDAADNITLDKEINNSPDQVQKQLKNLRKKLKQINELQIKIDNGSVVKLSPEEISKLHKKQIIEDTIKRLENMEI